jgi:hypothetical protein
MLAMLIHVHWYLSGTEKKLLQSMLRKASTNEGKADVSKSTTNKKDVFTSTEDLGNYFVYCAYYVPII